jgi:hypothetical protein
MLKIARSSIVAIALVLLAACGGGGSGGGGGGSAPADQALGGLWYGTLSIDGLAGTQSFVGMSTDDGRFRFISADTGGQFVGTVQVDGTTVSGSGKGFAPDGTTWRDGSTVTTATMTGTLRQRSSFVGSWSTGTGESGTFSFSYDADYEKDSSLALLEGVWIVYDDNLNPYATFTIDPDGGFSGQNIVGCTSMGQISIIDPRSNIYEITSTISNCAIAGEYTGLGVLGSIVNSNDAFLFSVNSDVRALLLGLER